MYLKNKPKLDLIIMFRTCPTPPYSIILLVLVDPNSRFKYIDVSANGKGSDASVFRESSLFKALENNTLIPPKMLLL